MSAHKPDEKKDPKAHGPEKAAPAPAEKPAAKPASAPANPATPAQAAPAPAPKPALAVATPADKAAAAPAAAPVGGAPAAAGAAAPKPAAAAPAKPAAKPLPTPVFNPAYKGKLLTTDRYWPTERWRDIWSVPGYKTAAGILFALIVAPPFVAALIGELAEGTKLFSGALGAVAGALAGAGLDLGAGAQGGLVPFLWALVSAVVAKVGLPPFAATVVWTAIKILVVLHLILVAPIFIVWWERKISAHMQSRLGPMYVGGWHGVLQTVADGIKLLFKEDVTPEAADKWVHRLAPLVVVFPCILAFAPVSFGKELSAADLDVGAFYVFAVAGVSVIGIMMAGWGSGNKYSLLGGLRSAAQLVSYELPRSFSIVPVLMFAGSLNLTQIAAAQSGHWFGLVPKWFLFYPVVGQVSFLIFLIASVAETNRIPFDLPEAESELVAGFHTEFSGMKFSLFFLAEYAYVFLASCLAAAFFMGGGGAPLNIAPLTLVPSWAWFLGKVLLIVFCFLWFRWTFPRFRVDRVMDFNWKFLLPWSFGNIALAGLYLALLK